MWFVGSQGTIWFNVLVWVAVYIVVACLMLVFVSFFIFFSFTVISLACCHLWRNKLTIIASHCIIGQVRWQTVLWGIGLQFIFALVVLRWPAGYMALKWLGDRFHEFLAYSNVGAEFVFGRSYAEHFFAFKVIRLFLFAKRTLYTRRNSEATSDIACSINLLT